MIKLRHILFILVALLLMVTMIIAYM